MAGVITQLAGVNFVFPIPDQQPKFSSELRRNTNNMDNSLALEQRIRLLEEGRTPQPTRLTQNEQGCPRGLTFLCTSVPWLIVIGIIIYGFTSCAETSIGDAHVLVCAWKS